MGVGDVLFLDLRIDSVMKEEAFGKVGESVSVNIFNFDSKEVSIQLTVSEEADKLMGGNLDSVESIQVTAEINSPSRAHFGTPK